MLPARRSTRPSLLLLLPRPQHVAWWYILMTTQCIDSTALVTVHATSTTFSIMLVSNSRFTDKIRSLICFALGRASYNRFTAAPLPIPWNLPFPERPYSAAPTVAVPPTTVLPPPTTAVTTTVYPTTVTPSQSVTQTYVVSGAPTAGVNPSYK